MLQAAGALNSRLAALGAALVPQHAQLVFALTRDLQVTELIFDALVHFKSLSTAKGRPGEGWPFFQSQAKGVLRGRGYHVSQAKSRQQKANKNGLFNPFVPE
jgi:hypothetical protein